MRRAVARFTVIPLFYLLLLSEAVAAALSDVDAILDRTVRATAEVKAYAAEINTASTFETLAAGAGSASDIPAPAVPSIQTIMFRVPGYIWKHRGTSSGDISLTLGDGKAIYEYSGFRPQKISQQELENLSEEPLPGYPDLKVSSAFPLLDQLRILSNWRTLASAKHYRGQEVVAGVLCHVLESKQPPPFDDATWKRMRQGNPDLAEQPHDSAHLLYIGVEDSLLRRSVSINHLPGVRHLSETNYVLKRPDPAAAFDYERLTRTLRPLLGDRPLPPVEYMLTPIGKPLPEVGGLRADGKPLRWADFRGDVLVVETWATWCTYCKSAFPFYDKMRRRLEGQGVVFVALNFQAEQEAYEKWVARHGGKYGFVFARGDMTEENWKQQLERFKGSMPAFYVVGRDGKVVAGYIGFSYGHGNDDPRLIGALRKAGVEL